MALELIWLRGYMDQDKDLTMGLLKVLGEEEGDLDSSPYSTPTHFLIQIWELTSLGLSFLASKMRSLDLCCLPHEITRRKRQCVGKPFVKCERSLLPEGMNKGSSTVFLLLLHVDF